MIYEHYDDVPRSMWRWPNFSPGEKNLACPCCGEFYYDAAAMDALQATRSLLGRALTVNSGHRCRRYNRSPRIRGALNSQHLKIAFDLAIGEHGPAALLSCAQRAGFTSFGFYGSFLHVDTRPGRRWITKAGRETWKSLVT